VVQSWADCVQRRFEWNPSRNGILLSTAATVNKLIGNADEWRYLRRRLISKHIHKGVLCWLLCDHNWNHFLFSMGLAHGWTNWGDIFKLLISPRISSLCSQAGRYYNPIPAQFHTLIDCFIIPTRINGATAPNNMI